MQNSDSILKKLFNYISDNNLHWEDMGDVYDKIIIGDKEYDFVKGVENFKNKMLTYFPEEEKAITQYIRIILDISKTSRTFYLDKALPPLLSKLIGISMRKPYNKYSDKKTYETLKSITNNEKLIKVLFGQYGDYGLAPKESSIVMQLRL